MPESDLYTIYFSYQASYRKGIHVDTTLSVVDQPLGHFRLKPPDVDAYLRSASSYQFRAVTCDPHPLGHNVILVYLCLFLKISSSILLYRLLYEAGDR